MIITRLTGGLGNQMFQYALARRLAYERRVNLKVDLTWFQTQSLRKFMLDRFKIIAEIATPKEIVRFTKPKWPGIPSRIQRAALFFLHKNPYRLVEEVDSAFNQDVFKVGRNALLVGYWQSEKYFLPLQQIIREEFKLKESLTQECLNWAEKIQLCNSISIHVRRGDYNSDTITNQLHGTLPISYYQNAVEYLLKNSPNSKFFIFSDDLPWVYQNLNFHSPYEFVCFVGNKRDEEELFLMSLCKNHIIANSTFSWWGAWLCTYPRKTVIAPKKWFKNADFTNIDLLPASWIKI